MSADDLVLAPVGRPGAEPAANRFLDGLRSSPKGIVGAAVLLVVLAVAVAAPAIAPNDPSASVIADRFRPPAWLEGGSWTHVLGGDNLGRDIFSRVLVGSQVSIAIGLAVVAVAMVTGSLIGAVAGYFGGMVDSVIMRIVDFQLSFPFILLAIMFMAVLGPGLWSTFVALSFAIWVNYARLVRGEALKLRDLEYIQAARSIGVRSRTIVLKHILPNVLPTIIVMATLDVAWVIIFEAALSFLGLGVQPPTPSWGIMISEGRNYLYECQWMTLGPGLAILVTSIGINLFGDFLRDTYDPRLVRL